MRTRPVKPWFNVLVVFSTPDAGVRALILFQRLTERLAGDYLMEQNTVNIRSLVSPETARQAAYDAAAADMILVSVDTEEELTGVFKAWTDTWPEPLSPSRRLLTGFVHEKHATDAPSGNSYLEELADRKDMDFISYHDGAKEPADRRIPLDWMDEQIDLPSAVRRSDRVVCR